MTREARSATPFVGVLALWERVGPWFETRAAAAACFVSGLVVFGIESIAWPLSNGRDGTTYLMYYLDMWHEHPAYRMLMLFRTPLAPLFYGPFLQVGGAALAEVASAVAFAVSVVAFASAALAFGRLAAFLTGLALLAYPAYCALFHQVSSDPVFALVFSLWSLAVVRAFRSPRAFSFAVVGVCSALLVLARPAAQILLVFGLAGALLPSGAWRARAARAVAFVVAAGVLVVGWEAYNDARYGDFTVSRGGWASTPFYRVFVMDKLVQPRNGPASRELAVAVGRDLLTRPPYAQSHTSLTTFFTLETDHMWGDLVWLSDYRWGWSTRYSILRRAAFEAIERHPRLYARDVALAVKFELFSPYRWAAPSVVAARSSSIPAASHPSADLGGYRWWLATAPGGTPPVQSREARLTSEVRRLGDDLPDRSGSAGLASVLNGISRIYPRPVIWLAVGLLALVIRRRVRAGAVLFLTVASLGLLVFTMLGNPPALEYGLPVQPIFVLLALVALAGARGGSRSVRQPTSDRRYGRVVRDYERRAGE